jgi:spore germination protein KA
MIPSDLLLSIAASRERMPFPAVIEILLMETTFELLREAGIRIPTTIGPTIGIVGALILGQAAVEANIISPILVIIVSITGLASFALPELGISYMMRSWRFIFLFAGAFMGFYGIALALTLSIAYVSTIESFGVPYFSPMAPHYPSSKDTVT